MENLLNVSNGILKKNLRVKVSPVTGEVYEILYCNKEKFKDSGWEETNKKIKKVISEEVEAIENIEEVEEERKPINMRSAQVSKRRILDYARSNDFDLFFTLTLDKEKVNSRYDVAENVKRFGIWADNMVRRKGLKYLVVPELHKDGAIHFHGLCNSSACVLKDSGKYNPKNRTQKIYNLESWKFGITTACIIDDHLENISNYITKYVVKQLDEGKIGGRYFYHSNNLSSPVIKLYNLAEPPSEAAIKNTVKIQDINITFSYINKQNFNEILKEVSYI